jgi:7-cyano-7-deazaguanine synthase
MKKYVVLLSSGLDSTVNLYAAQKQGQVVLALTFDYGQRAAVQEISHAQKLCQNLKIPHQVIDLKWMKSWGKSSLLDTQKDIPVADQIQMDDLKTSLQTAEKVWVPNRNGVLLNLAAGFAESLAADVIVPGFNKEEAATFPDNTEEFLNQVTASLFYSTANHVKAECFTTRMNKSEIVAWGKELGVDWSLIWPCYFAQEKWCGQCESCQRSLRALKAQGVELS